MFTPAEDEGTTHPTGNMQLSTHNWTCPRSTQVLKPEDAVFWRNSARRRAGLLSQGGGSLEIAHQHAEPRSRPLSRWPPATQHSGRATRAARPIVMIRVQDSFEREAAREASRRTRSRGSDVASSPPASGKNPAGATICQWRRKPGYTTCSSGSWHEKFVIA